MAADRCCRCLSRLRISIDPTNAVRPHSIARSSFSTTSKASFSLKGSKIGKKRNLQAKAAKRPAPGERKALRKRVVLSNINAFEVPGLTDVAPSNFAQDDLLGNMVGLPNDVIDQLRAIESFKPKQGWGYFRRPAALVRKETLDIAKFIDKNDNTDVYRRVIAGEKGSGKSVLMLQAHAMAFLKQWVVIHLPEAAEMTSAGTAYEPIPDTSPTSYAQRDFIATLLGRIAKANKGVLSKLQISKKHDVGKPLQDNISLHKLCEAGAEDSKISYEIFQAFWSELQIKGRPPVLFTLDNLTHISRFSEYLTPDMHYIHAHDLNIVGHFMKCLTGEMALPNGGMVLAANSHSNSAPSPALRLSLRLRSVMQGDSHEADLTKEQAEALLKRSADADAILFDPSSPYTSIDQRSLRALIGVETLTTPGLNREEARTVLEYYAMSGMLRATITEALVAEKRATSGGGIIGELEKGSVRRSLY